MTQTVIEPFTQKDLADIAYIHTRVWQTAYVGQMPREYLDGLDPAERLKKWQAIFDDSQKDSRHGTLVARVAGKRVGFLSYGPARDTDREGWAEIYAIYVLQEYAGHGAGYGLFRAAQEILVRQGFDKAYLWALENNKLALNAYRQWQGTVETNSTKTAIIANAPLKEVAVSFRLIPKP